eukprot:9369899-Alexandrium_andersonii.AAC.1
MRLFGQAHIVAPLRVLHSLVGRSTAASSVVRASIAPASTLMSVRGLTAPRTAPGLRIPPMWRGR